MREIKFRVWSNELNKMVYADKRGWYHNCFIGDNQFFQTCSLGVAIDRNGKQVEVLQYTGLKDKNGKEIYEGDIVRYQQRNLEAAFGMVEGEDYIEKTRTIKFNDQSFNVPAGFIKDLEVIGNIHENPELVQS